MPAHWDNLTDASVIATRSRPEWLEVFEGTDACVAPVLTMGEAPAHPHNRSRATFVTRDGIVQPAPAPRFSRTSAEIQGPPPRPGEHTDDVLLDWGFDADDVAKLREAGAVH